MSLKVSSEYQNVLTTKWKLLEKAISERNSKRNIPEQNFGHRHSEQTHAM